MIKTSFLRLCIYILMTGWLLMFSVPMSRAASQDNNVEWGINDVRHDTRDLTYRNPFGAVPTGTAITIRMRVRSFDLTSMNLYVWNAHGGDLTLPMSWQYNVDCPDTPGPDLSCDIWAATIPASATTSPRILYYKFQLVDGTDSDWYVDDHAHNSYDHEDRFENGTGIMVDENDSTVINNSFNITVYNASAYATHLDSWASNAVIYQIMPDRFRNGDPTNDQWVYNDVYGNPVTLHATWHEAPEDARVTNQWSRDFFGGDLQGVMDELDYLEWLGVTAIYFNPIFNSPSNHGYDTTDYLNINPRYGNNALFQQFATEAESRGIKIILDGVFNHTGSDSRYFDRYSRWDANGNPSLGNDGSGACEAASSSFASFYQFLGAPFTGPCYGGRRYESWWGYDTLPNLVDWVASNSVRDYVFDVNNDGTNGVTSGMAVIQYWYSLGADGWRFDVADEIPHSFWSQFRTQVKNNDNLNGPLYSEVWFEAQPWLFGDQLDSTMNYRYRKAVLGFLIDSTWTDNDNNGDQTMYYLPPSSFDYVLNSIREDYPAPAWYAMMNLMGSHDTNRALFVLREKSSDLTTALKKMQMMAALQFTYPGAPTVYYGDEVGLGARDYGGYANWGAGKTVTGIIQDDPYNRHPMVWSYDNYSFDSSDGALPSGLPNTDLQHYYRTLALARRNYEVLRTGDLWTITIRDDLQTYGYVRFDTVTGQCAIAFFNRDLNNTRNITNNSDFPLPAVCTGTFYDILPDNGVNNATGWTVSGSSITVTGVLPLTSVLLVKPMDNPNTTPVVSVFPPMGIAFTAGDNSIATSASTPVTVTLNTLQDMPISAGESVSFTLVSGGGSLSATSATTNSSGEATVNYNAPSMPTTALIRASIVSHDGKSYDTLFTVHVGLDNGADTSGLDNLVANIGPERVGNLSPIGITMTKYGNSQVAMSVSAFTENPYDGPPASSLRSSVVQATLASATGVSAVDLVVKYTHGASENSYNLWWWNGTYWQTVADTIRDTTADTIRFRVTNSTTPNLSNLVGGAVFFVNVAPQFQLNFASNQIGLNATTVLNITIDNSDLSGLSNVGFTLNLPSGLVVATPPNASNPCAGGTFSPIGGGSSITLSGGTIAPDSICTLSVSVTGTVGGVKTTSTTLNAIFDGQPINVASNTVTVYVAFKPFMNEQELLYHLQTNAVPSGWTYILADFITPDKLRIVAVINGETGIIELTVSSVSGGTMMRWSVSNITNTSGGATSSQYADVARHHILNALAQAINTYAHGIVGTTNYDLLSYQLFSDGVELELVEVP